VSIAMRIPTCQRLSYSGSVLSWTLAFGLGLFPSCGQRIAFVLKGGGGVPPTDKVAVNSHQGTALGRHAQVGNFAVYGDPQCGFEELPGLLFRDLQGHVESIRLAREKWDTILCRPDLSCAGKVTKELEHCIHRKRESAFVRDIEVNAQEVYRLWLYVSPNMAGSPVPNRDPLHHCGFLQLNLPLQVFCLCLNGAESTDGSIYASSADNKQQPADDSSDNCKAERPSVPVLLGVVYSFVFGGFGFALWMLFYINDERRILRASLSISGLACAGFGLLFLVLTGLYPHTWGLPPQWLPTKWNPCKQGNQSGTLSHGKNVSQKLLQEAQLLYYNKDMANVLGTDKQIAIIGSLAEGSSIRSIERVTGVHRDTIMRLGVRIGKGCTALLDAKMRNLNCQRLEMDEIWGFVGKKDRHVRPGDDPQFGNVWTFCAIDSDTKLVPAFRVGNDRDAKTATAFMLDVAGRMKNRVQVSTDGLRAYVEAIDWAFSGNVDYGQIIKTYGVEESIQPQRRYSAPEIVSTEKKAVFGSPKFDLISTSYIERLNATTRLHMKRLTRLTYAFSKKRENFEAAVGLHFAYYNFVRRHNTLRCTPAMAAGVTQSFWGVGDLLEAAA
jgi:IS1 family transposase